MFQKRNRRKNQKRRKIRVRKRITRKRVALRRNNHFFPTFSKSVLGLTLLYLLKNHRRKMTTSMRRIHPTIFPAEEAFLTSPQVERQQNPSLTMTTSPLQISFYEHLFPLSCKQVVTITSPSSFTSSSAGAT